MVHSDDIDEHALAQANWSLQYDQLSHGRFAGNLNHVQLPGVRLVFEAMSCAVRQVGSLGYGSYGFAMTLDQPGEAIFNGQRLSKQSIMIGRSEELDLSSPPDFSMIGIVVDGELLSALWERMYQKPASSWLDHQIVVSANHEVVNDLRATHMGVIDRINASPDILHDALATLQMRDAILMEWIEAIPSRVDISEIKSVDARKRVVKRACEMMLEQRDQPMTVLSLCSRIGASPRKLDYCFQDILGISPVKYLRAVRLNGVRRDLKNNMDLRTGVTDIAVRWGFWHFGNFSYLYKRQFGELPSETLRQTRLVQ